MLGALKIGEHEMDSDFAFVQISRILSVLVLPHGVMTRAGVS